jgi:hypothetical protein
MSLFSAAFSTEVSTLELRIVKAEGLADRGGVFKSPPYVYVDAQLWEERNGIPSVYFTSLGQTEVVSALDPVLDTTYYAEVPPSKLGTICLKLRTFDKKLVGEDELLGEVVVSAEDMNQTMRPPMASLRQRFHFSPCRKPIRGPQSKLQNRPMHPLRKAISPSHGQSTKMHFRQ